MAETSEIRLTDERIEIMAPGMLGNNFAFHYSINGEDFCMMRCCHLPAERVAKVGLLAPFGDGGVRVYEHLSIRPVTVKNIRAGK